MRRDPFVLLPLLMVVVLLVSWPAVAQFEPGGPSGGASGSSSSSSSSSVSQSATCQDVDGVTMVVVNVSFVLNPPQVIPIEGYGAVVGINGEGSDLTVCWDCGDECSLDLERILLSTDEGQTFPDTLYYGQGMTTLPQEEVICWPWDVPSAGDEPQCLMIVEAREEPEGNMQGHPDSVEPGDLDARMGSGNGSPLGSDCRRADVGISNRHCQGKRIAILDPREDSSNPSLGHVSPFELEGAVSHEGPSDDSAISPGYANGRADEHQSLDRRADATCANTSAVGPAESGCAMSAAAKDASANDASADLSQVRILPNPFDDVTRIKFDLPDGGPVRIEIYDVGGRRVRELCGGDLDRGTHAVSWDSRDANGCRVAAGVYFCRLWAGGTVETRKLVLRK